MKLGDVLKKEREKVGLSAEQVAERLGLPAAEYLGLESGDSPAEEWGPRLAQIAIALETPTSRLLAESGRAADTRPGQAGRLIRRHRDRRELSAAEVVEKIQPSLPEGLTFSGPDYDLVEAGKSPIERYGPLLLGFAEVIEQPVFNLFYPCGLPFQELDDYP